MTDTAPSSGSTWRYRFSRPDKVEIGICDFNGDDAAETYAKELSKTQKTAVKFFRHNDVDWEYLGEVDERR